MGGVFSRGKPEFYERFTETPRNPEAKPATLGAALDLVLGDTGRKVRDGARSAGTLKMQRQHVGWLLHVVGADQELERVTERFLEDLVEHARTRGGRDGGTLDVKTVQKRMSTLRRALVLAFKAGGVSRVPLFPAFHRPPLASVPSVFQTGADFWRLFRALPRGRAEWLAVCFFTIQRAADVERMRWSDVDLGSRPTMLIRSTKNRKPYQIRVRCPRPLAELLRERRARLAACGRAVGPGDRLVDPWPNRAIMIARACFRVGLPPMNSTKLRHAATSAMVRRIGITPATQRLGGWSSARLMEVVYAHALPAQLDEGMGELESFVDGS